MPKPQLPKSFQPNETICLRDEAWGILFPEYWADYRSRNSLMCSANLRMLARDGDTYRVQLLYVCPCDGRPWYPTNLTVTVPLKQIHLALLASREKPMEPLPTNRKPKAKRSLIPTKTSRYRGVSRGIDANGEPRWKAFIGVKQHTHWLGTFKTENEAAQAFNTASFEHHGAKGFQNEIVE